MVDERAGVGTVIVAGWLQVDPAVRDDYVASCADVVRAARSAVGCLDFAISADVVDPARVTVFERWVGEDELLAFRGSGPSDEQQAEVVAADVRRYLVAGEGPA